MAEHVASRRARCALEAARPLLDQNFRVTFIVLLVNAVYPRPILMSTAAAQVPRRMVGRNANSAVTLNLDILRNILTFIEDPEDLLAAMSTSRALYSAGIQPLVRLPTTISEDELRSFHDFMLAHSPASFLAFQAFYLDVENDAPDTSLLTDLLKRGTNLRELDLPSSVFTQSGTKDVSEAIISLTDLNELTINSGGKPGVILNILTRLQSPLINISVVFEEDPQDPIAILANFRHTLEQAQLVSVTFASMAFCYTKLVDLDIIVSDRPSLSVLSTAFPNLRKLALNTGELWAGRIQDTEQLEDLRIQNTAFQEGRECWKSLISVKADLVSLYALDLKNSLKSLEIIPMRLKPSHVELSYLRTVISTTHTETLSFDVPDIAGVLSELLSGGLANPTVLLELQARLYRQIGSGNTVDDLIKGLASINTVMLHLTLEVVDVIALSEVGVDVVRPYPTKDLLDPLNERSLANRIGTSMRNVALIALRIGDRRVSYWTSPRTEMDEWEQARLDELEAISGLARLFSRAFSILSSRDDNDR